MKVSLEISLKKLKNLGQEIETGLFIPGKIEDGINIELDKAFHLEKLIIMDELISSDALNLTFYSLIISCNRYKSLMVYPLVRT